MAVSQPTSEKPSKQPTDSNIDSHRSTRSLHTAMRAIGERANSILKTTWASLRRVTLCPNRIGDIVAAAIVLSQWQRGRY